MDPVLALGIALALVLGAIIVLLAEHYSAAIHAPTKSGAQLPKGSMGWPIIGESISFAINPADYVASHVSRYGTIFKTSLSFKPAILGSTPEFAKFVLNDNILFINGAPPTTRAVLGVKSVLFQDGPKHLAMKRLIQKALLPEALKQTVTPLETVVCENLAAWADKGSVNAREATQRMAFDVSMWLLLGMGDVRSTEEGRTAHENFKRLNEALGAVPLNIPGTTYGKGVKAKAALAKYVKEIMQTRRAQRDTKTDILGMMLASRDNPQESEEVRELDDDTIADNVVLLFFAANDNTSTTFTWALKYLFENPEVFRLIQAEQQEVLKSKDPSKEGRKLSFHDISKMIYTRKLFLELQRLLSIAPVVARQATRDVEFEGHLIPKGWLVLPMHNFIHNNSAFHSNPKALSPERFDDAPKPYTFLPFSAGPHQCPGTNFAVTIFSIFLYHLTTTYRYEGTAPDMGVEYIFYPSPIGGFPINIHPQNTVASYDGGS